MSENGSQKMQSTVYRTCAEFDEMFHVPKSTNSNEILDVNEICDQALGHAVADVNEEAVENGDGMATFDELFSFNKENRADEYVDSPDVATKQDESVLEETLIAEAPVEHHGEPTLESMLSVDPECLPAPDVDAPTLESKLEALVGEMKPETGKNRNEEPQASDFGPGANNSEEAQVFLDSEEVVVGSQELNPDDYEILDGPIETHVNDEEMTLNLVPVEEGTVPVEDQQAHQAYENGGDHFVEGANSHKFAHEAHEHGEHVLYDIAEQNENSIFDEKPKPNLFAQNSQNVDDRIQAQVISQKPIQPRPVGVTPAPIKAKKPRVRARPKRKPSIQSVSASPAPTILTLVPTSGTGTVAAGAQSTISSSVAQSSNILSVSGSNNIQIIQSPQILSAGGTQVYQLGPNGTLTPVMQPLIQQFVLQPVNSTESSSNGSRVIRLQSTPAGVQQVPTTMTLSSTQTPMILNSTPNRRLSLQTEIAPGSSSRQQLIKPSSILTPLVPDKSTPVPLTPNGTNLGSVFKTMQLHSPAIRPAEPNHPGLSAQDRLIKQRQEMRKRYEMLREAAEIRRDETFKPYRARKVRGRPHPDPVIESIALSSVTVPDVSTKISLPHDIVEEGKLSDLQLEAVVYAKQQHAGFYPSGERKGFLLGDGAGVGKGRSISGIIYDNWLNGRKKAIWLSVSNDLRHDSLRDLGDIGADMIKVHPLHKFKYGHKLSDKENGRIQEGVIFGTYASLIGERHQAGATTKRAAQATRLHQLVTWCGRNFDGCIVFDECHKAKNLYQANGKPSKTGTTVLELQRQLKQARIVYASATGASEPKHMSYMSRLGLWGAGTGFKSSEQFVDALTKAGVGAMELVAMDMKRRGVYLARQLSFEGCAFELEEVPLDGFFMTLYDAAAELWRDAKEYFSQAANLLGDDFKMPGMWQQFWGAHQRFFKYLTMAAKVNKACQIARKAVRENQCVVIGLQSTGEQRTNEEMDRIIAEGEEINEMVSSCKGVFRRLLDTHFPVSDRDKLAELGINFDLPDSPDAARNSSDKKPRYMSLNTTADSNLESDQEDDLGDLTAAFGESDDENDPNATDKEKQDTKKRVRVDSISDHFRAAGFKMRKVDKEAEEHRKRKEAIEQCAHLKRTLWEKLLKIQNLPGNALDELMDGLGGPEMVSEMTGRKNRQIITDKGVQYENRAQSANVPLEQINLIEKEHFMSGKKQYAIISDAASSGISLHCDRRCANQNRRVHLTLELPWSADKAVQQFGRTHRSNQVCPPKYCFLISELAGEQRFASIVARRLESMGALTHGDRRTAQKHGDLSRFNFDTNYGKKSLDLVLKSILGEERNSVSFPEFYHGNFVEDMKRALYEIGIFVWKDESKTRMRTDGDITVSKFLNRLLGISIACQQGLFHYFSETLDDIMTEARANGTLEEGVMDVGNANDKLEIAGQNTFTTSDDCTLKLVKINHYKGVEWVDALNQSKRLAGKFYVDESGKLPVMLYPKGDKFVCIRPNHSVVDSSFEMSYWQTQFKLKEEPVDPSSMAQIWRECYQETANKCIHEFTNGFCSEGLDGGCLTGRRLLELFILSGPVLAVWNSIQDILHQVDKASRIQIVRLRTSDRERIVGILIPSNCAQTLVKTLEKIQEKNKPKTKSKLGRKKKVLAEATAQVLTAAQQMERDRELELMASQIINEAGGAAISPHVGSVGNSSSGFDEPRDEEVTEEQRQKDFAMMDEEARDAEFERLAAQMVFQNDEEEDDFF